MLKNIVASLFGLFSLSASAENGMDYTLMMTCSSPDGQLRIDNYYGYGHGDGYRRHMQFVFSGSMSAALKDEGVYPSKDSSVPGEFIIDRLETDLVQGFDFASRSVPGGNDFYTVLLNKHEGRLIVTSYFSDGELDKSVTFSGVSCQ